MNTSVSLRNTLLRATALMLFLSACIMFLGCSSNITVDTGRTFETSDFSEANAREVLKIAVRDECAKSNVGISSGLASALRIADSAPAVKREDNWEFSYNQKTALITPSGTVTGELLSDLISQCR